jgi:hypothetical protein
MKARFSGLVLFLACMVSNNGAFGTTLWSEGAETGLTHVIDGTGPGYGLIQSDVVAHGNYAFHLANPDFEDNWFEIDQTLRVEQDSRLFFLSRLRYATASQVARVQVSTDGGMTWPVSIFDQPGSDGPGEGAFSLKDVNLGGYADQDLRFRFLYDFDSGSAYTQTDSQSGWFVDQIRIGSEFEKLQWDIGDPSPHEQLSLEYINRARADALTEAERLSTETDPDIRDAYRFFNIDGRDIIDQFAWYVASGAIDRVAQPLSFDADLLTAAELHSQDMLENRFQGHVSSNNPPAPFQPGFSPTERVNAVGYEGSVAENVYSSAESVRQGHAGFDVDWGDLTRPESPWYNPTFNGQGMQNPAGHRMSIHNGDYKEFGVGVILGTNGFVGPEVVTQEFANPGSVSYVTGVVFEDLNANAFYDIGEGRPDVRVDVEGSPYFAISSSSGGYSVPVAADGTYAVTFSGGGFEPFLADAIIANGQNVKVDYLVSALIGLAGDYNASGTVEQADLDLVLLHWGQSAATIPATWTNDLPTGNIDQEELDGVLLNWGHSGSGTAAVPEPASSFLLTLCGVLALVLLRRRGRAPT